MIEMNLVFNCEGNNLFVNIQGLFAGADPGENLTVAN